MLRRSFWSPSGGGSAITLVGSSSIDITESPVGTFTFTALPAGITLAGDVDGPADANIVSTLTGTAGVVSVPTAALTFGTNPASTGNLRAPNATTIIAARNAANNANLSLLITDTSNQAFFGTGAAVSTLGSTGRVDLAISGGAQLQVFSTKVQPVNANFLWNVATSSPVIGQDTRTTNAAPNNLTIQPQQPLTPNGSATTVTGKPGNLEILLGTPVSPATAYGRIVARTGSTAGSGTVQWTMQSVLEGSATNGLTLIGGSSTSADAYLQLLTGAGWTLTSGSAGSTGTLNAGTTINLQIGGTTKIQIQSTIISLAGSGITQVTAPTTVTCSSGTNWLLQHANRNTNIAPPLMRLIGSAASGTATGTNRDGAPVEIRGGQRTDTNGRRLGVRIILENSTAEYMVEAADVQAAATSASRVLALLGSTAVDTTKMPTGTGDMVMHVANCATAPTADPTGGAVWYVEGGATKIRGSGGTITTIAPA